MADVPSDVGRVGGGHAGCTEARGRADRRGGGAGSRSSGHSTPPCSRAPRSRATLPDPSRSPFGHRRGARRRQPLRLRGPRAALLRRPPARPPTPGLRSRAARRARGADRRSGGSHARAVHDVARDAGRSRRAPASAAGYTILAQGDLPKPAAVAASPTSTPSCLFATDGLLAGRSTCRADPLARHDRPPPVPPARRPAAASPPRACRARAFRGDRPPACGHAAGAGDGAPHPHRDRSGRGRRARPAPGQRGLPLGPRARAPADAPHAPSGRSRAFLRALR